MGIPGILREIGKGQRIALAKLAVEHLERTQRPLRIAIDAAIWGFQNQASQGGLNPEVRVFYYRLLRLLALPIHPLFVYDGPNKPRLKRNKKVSVWNSKEQELSKRLLQLFHFPYISAPGEAEAECAALQRCGIVDAVMSTDADAVMFGSTLTLKNWSHEAQRGNHSPSHVDVLRAEEIVQRTGLTIDGMILVALLSGGDYDTEGIKRCGANIAIEIAKVKQPNFAADLLSLKSKNDAKGLQEWRDTLNHELRTNEHKFFRTRHSDIIIPNDFPNDSILGFYTNPAVSTPEKLRAIEESITQEWAQEIRLSANIPDLREFTRDHLEWKYKSGGRKFIRGLAPSLLAQRLRLKQPMNSILGTSSILSRGEHFENDGIPEIRLQYIPSQVIPLDLSQEEDNPAYAPQGADGDEAILEEEQMNVPASQADVTMSPTKSRIRKSPPWNPDASEKIWLPETIVKQGIAEIVDQWDREQEEIRNDPKKFAVRKAVKAKITDPNMKVGAMDAFFKQTKAGNARLPAMPPTGNEHSKIRETKAAQKRAPVPIVKKAFDGSPRRDRSISHFFTPYARTTPEPDLPMVRTFHDKAGNRSEVSKGDSSSGMNIANSIYIDSDPIDIDAQQPTSSATVGEHVGSMRRRDHRVLDMEDDNPSSSEPLPNPDQLLSSFAVQTGATAATSFSTTIPTSSPAFEIMSPTRFTTKSKNKTPYKSTSKVTKKSSAPKSPSPSSSSIKTAFLTTKSNTGDQVPSQKAKIAVIARESLPGAWKELNLDLLEEDGYWDEPELEERTDRIDRRSGKSSAPERRRKRLAQRVSLLDMTES